MTPSGLPTVSKRRKKWLAIATVIVASLFAFACTELVLKIFLPFPRPATIGHTASLNARLYGWGFSPGEEILLGNPDTGEVYRSVANNHGWRDLDRTFSNPDGKYRILVLGDSVTFGPVVPDDKTYTRILANKLQAAGYNAEVINISYGRWGTDQELEALTQEGVKYKPNLIVLQFDTNDIADNVFYRSESSRHLKPIFYSLDDNGNLVRSLNPYFSRDTRSIKDRIKNIVIMSEIGKRLYRRYVMPNGSKIATQANYKITATKLDQLRVFLRILPDHQFLKSVRDLADKPLNRKLLEEIISAHHFEAQTDMILRILEDRWFNASWRPDRLAPRKPNVGTIEWRLYFKLVEEVDKVSRDNGAKLLLFSDNEPGHYEWETYWFRIVDTAESRESYLAPNEMVRAFAVRHGIGFIPQKRKYLRCRNDPHPSPLGNEAVADDIFEYLIEHHLPELSVFKKPDRS